MLVHETHFRGSLRSGFQGESDERTEMATQSEEGGVTPGEIIGVERPFERAGCDGDDAAEGAGALEEGEECGDEAVAGVEVQCCYCRQAF
jgi:hypothetical protein